MIIVTAVRWCLSCGKMTSHQVEQKLRRGKRIDVHQRCETCGKGREIVGPGASRTNGGMGDQRYRSRRAAQG